MRRKQPLFLGKVLPCLLIILAGGLSAPTSSRLGAQEPASASENPEKPENPGISERPRLSIFPLENSESAARYDSLCRTITDTITLNLGLIGTHQLVPPPEAPGNPEEELEFIRSRKINNIISGRLSVDPNNRVTIEASVYDGRMKKTTAQFQETSRGLLGSFDAADRLVRDLLQSLSDREIAYGGLKFVNAGVPGSCTIQLDQETLQGPPQDVPQLLTGRYSLRITQERPLESLTLYEGEILITKGNETEVPLTIPALTHRESQMIQDLERQWRRWWGRSAEFTREALTAAEDLGNRGADDSPALAALKTQSESLLKRLNGKTD